MLELLKALDAFVWGPPLLILLVGTGIYLTIRLGLLQVTRLPKAFQLIFPVPTVAARAVQRAAKLDTSPCPLSLVKIN